MAEMKKIAITIVSLIGVFFLAGCATSDDPPEPGSEESIAFNANVPSAVPGAAATRSDSPCITTATLSRILVNGYLNAKVYMQNVLLSKNNSVWTYSPLRYWPIGQSLDFFSYAPTEMADSARTINYQFPERPIEGTAVPKINKFRSDGKTDLVYASNIAQTEQQGQIKINMQHALSKVSFRFRPKDTVSSVPYILTIDLKNIYDTGNFVFPDRTTTDNPSTSPKGSWTNVGNHKDITLLGFRGHNRKVTLDKQKNLNYSGYTFFLPQALGPLSLDGADKPKGTYLKMALAFEKDEVPVWPYPSSHGYDSTEKTAVIYFPLTTDKITAWQPGKSYIYTVTVGIPKDASPISFDVDVIEYEGISDLDVPNYQ